MHLDAMRNFGLVGLAIKEKFVGIGVVKLDAMIPKTSERR